MIIFVSLIEAYSPYLLKEGVGFFCFMTDNIQSIESPVILSNGKEVYTYEYIEKLREENVELISSGKQIFNICPQAGFQEKLITCPADFIVCGGERGPGKTAGMLISVIPYISSPYFTCNGFRKEEDDIKRGLWKSSKVFFSGLAEPKESYFTWDFKSGAKVTFEHLQNESKDTIDRRFRGAEMPFIIIDELPQLKFDTVFTLLASNRNTFGFKNRFIASCNPVSRKHWLYKFISWYINEDTNEIIPERDGVIRYFYKYGKDVTEIVWGNSKEEVYEKAKGFIDALHDDNLNEDGESKYDLITSFCFIQGKYSENKILRKADKSYRGRLAQKGDTQSLKDIKGIWGDDEESESLLTSEELERMFNNSPQTNGFRTAVADVALVRDSFVIGAFDGNHLFDVEIFNKVGSTTAADLVRKFLQKNNIRKENFLFDADGIGQYLVEPFSEAFPFNNNSQASNPQIWGNLKSECAEKWIKDVQEYKYSIDQTLRHRKFGIPAISFEDKIQSERPALKRKITTNGKYSLIQKSEMKQEIGHSPDIIEMCLMHKKFSQEPPIIEEGLELW